MTGLADAFGVIGSSTEHHLEASHAAGIALALTDRDEILGVVCRGMADAAAGTPVRSQTRFEIGSISKSFAAVVVLQEAEAGRLDLHASVNEILPWLGLPEPFGPITLHHLMTHTAGLLTGTEDAPTGPGALHRLRAVPATAPPGQRFWYSNDGWKVVGACLEEVTRRPIHELLEERLLAPLGMGSSTAAIVDETRRDLAVGYEPMYTDRPVHLRHPLVPATWTVSNTADGSIVSTVVDMSAYARFLLRRGDVPDGSGGRLLSEARFAELVEPRVDDGEGGRYGYGLWTEVVDGATWVGHSGGMVGYTALLVTAPDEGIAGVILQNGGGYRRELMRAAVATVRAALAGDRLPEPWSPPAATSIERASDYVGTYQGDDGRTLEVRAEDEGLVARFGPVSVRVERDPLNPDPTDRFVLPHEALERYELVFGRDASGAVVEAFHGPTWFRGAGYAGADPEELPTPWLAHVGLYRNDDPWSPVLRILPRKGRLVLQWPSSAGDDDAEAELRPLADGWFAAGEEPDPRRIRFLGSGAGGRSVVAEFNGGSWFRSFEEEVPV